MCPTEKIIYVPCQHTFILHIKEQFCDGDAAEQKQHCSKLQTPKTNRNVPTDGNDDHDGCPDCVGSRLNGPVPQQVRLARYQAGLPLPRTRRFTSDWTPPSNAPQASGPAGFDADTGTPSFERNPYGLASNPRLPDTAQGNIERGPPPGEEGSEDDESGSRTPRAFQSQDPSQDEGQGEGRGR
ncbi:hypothetical protein MMC11_007091 [Xylographa trunciseda]|nr:hypothetical protein [Xylographa trunciseda]